MKPAVLFLMLVLLASAVSAADCIDALDGMRITNDTTFCSDSYDVPNGIYIMEDNLTLDCGTAVLRGNMQEGKGIIIEGRKNVVVTRCNIITFDIGIFLQNSSFITLEDNALLKNRIGIRMMNAYENTIIKTADKSTQTPLSMVMSKFNRFDINKPIDEEYCADNLCNEEKDINPCVNDDFYCSPRCNEENDNDCIKKEIIKYEKPKDNKTEEKKVEEKVEPQPEKMTITPKKRGKGWLLYPIFYILVFLLIQFYEHVKKD
ncbi:right-handed parallel beta-helix repeat-containing protein [Candidatus Woesearchaeota archaeon]|nr:right-handed parallel beta-helix repeat-containing protein [Candidatus Woesearchaeota archaeon]MBW3006233.1 right-handed parallel beta-helix repeat-containing protein [Candidatus Woesearchaeota archaeon]